MLRDLRPAFRSLTGRRVDAATAVATLCLAIAANVAMFSVVDGVLLRPLPFEEPERLVRIVSHPQDNLEIDYEVSYPELEEVRRNARSFEGIAGYASSSGGLDIRVNGELVSMPGAIVSGNLFDVLGIEPLAGVPWRAQEDVVGSEPLAAISERLWRRVWNADPEIVGRTIEIDGQRHRITSVLPASFEYPPKAEVWVPVSTTIPSELLEDPHVRFFNPIARLAEGVSAKTASAEWNAIVDARIEPQLLASARTSVSAHPLAEDLLGASRSTLLFLWGAAGLVLLVAAANITNLQAVRALARRRETALRRSLGAGWRDIIRLSLWEGAMIAVLGCAAGTWLGGLGVRVLLRGSPTMLYRAELVRVDARAWLFAVLLGLGTTAVVGLAPLFASASGSLSAALGDGGTRSVGAGARSGLRAFVVLQAAVAVVLVLGATLLLRSFVMVSSVDPGFESDRVLSLRLVQTGADAPDALEQHGRIATLVERLAAIPEVDGAAGVLLRPLETVAGFDSAFTIEGRPPEESAEYPQLNYQAITPDYFRVIGSPLLEGRFFDARDNEDAPQVAILSRAVAQRFFGNGSPIGKRFKWGGADASGPWVEVVGVVADGRYRRMDEVSLNVFVPYRQSPWPLADLVIRSRHRQPGTLATAVRKEIAAAVLGIEATGFATLDQIARQSLAGPRFQTLLLASFALLALVLGAVGLYGVTAYLLATRKQEIGVRQALGAAPRDVFRLALGQALRLALCGIAIGLAAGFLAERSLSGFFGRSLYGIGPGDPASLAAAILVFLAVALLAALPPALRSRSVAPLEALRRD